MNWNEKPYHSLDWEVKKQCGRKLYKLSLNAGLNCPNRDGTLGRNGCIFCSEGGSGDFAQDASFSIKAQLKEAKKQVAQKLPKGKPYGYIAYFQAYTNTYGSLDYLERIFSEAIADDEVFVLSIATRPDCLPEEVMALLTRLNKEKPVWIELGLQTIHEKTARWMRRGYGLSCFSDAVARLKAAGLSVIVHVILGLWEEGERELLETIHYLNGQKIDGIKLQLLHMLKGTDLGKLYLEGKIEALSFQEYESLLFSAIAYLHPDITIHRITGDGPKKLLLAPLWSGNKREVLNRLHQDMKRLGIYQGMKIKEEKG